MAVVVDVVHFHDVVFETEQGARVDIKREMQVDGAGAGLFGVQVNFPKLS